MTTMLDRRALMLGGCAIAALAGCSTTAMGGGDATLVSTTNGPIRGQAADGVTEFLGVRYAKPPIGALRFQAPQKPAAWTGEVSAQAYGEAAVQMRTGAGAVGYPPVVQAAMTEAFRTPDYLKPGGDEDCLVLNVYSRRTGPSAGAKRPVMVWIHGGSFSYGSAAQNIYRGRNLAKNHDVVFVGVNHRLNVFGFLALDSAGVPGFAGSANAGLLDVVAALEWVRDNIAQFGGDPGNVTIFGQSGGGVKVSTLMAMPAAKGLFHKAVIQSGAGLRSQAKATASATATDFLNRLGIAPADAAARLAQLGTADILKVATAIGVNRFTPSLNEGSLPRNPFDPDAPAHMASVPLMIGFTKDEQTLYNVGDAGWQKMDEAQVLAAAERVAAGKGQAIVDAFKAAWPDYTPPYIFTQVTGMVSSMRSHHTLAARKARQPAPVYSYIFAHDLPPQGFILKSPHTAEIPYIMDNVAEAPLFAGATADDFALGKLMSRIWVNFARTGNPNVAGLPTWPKFDGEKRATMFLSTKPKVVEKPFETVWQILQTAPTATPT